MIFEKERERERIQPTTLPLGRTVTTMSRPYTARPASSPFFLGFLSCIPRAAARLALAALLLAGAGAIAAPASACPTSQPADAFFETCVTVGNTGNLFGYNALASFGSSSATTFDDDGTTRTFSALIYDAGSTALRLAFSTSFLNSNVKYGAWVLRIGSTDYPFTDGTISSSRLVEWSNPATTWTSSNINDEVSVSLRHSGVPGIVFSESSVEVTEGDTATYTVKLDRQPSATVTVDVTSLTTGDATVTVSPSQLTFTRTNWDTAQDVTVTGAQDADGLHGTTTVSHTGTGVVNADLEVDVSDDDAPSLVITGISEDETVEVAKGSSETITLALSRQPSHNVEVFLECCDLYLTIDNSTLIFTSSNWDQPQTVRLTDARSGIGLDRSSVEVRITPSSDDPDFDSENIDLRTVTVEFTDSQAVEVSFGAATYAVAEGGAVDVTVQLDRDGNRDGIVVPIEVVAGETTATDPDDYTLSPTSLTFNAGETSKTVTLTAVADSTAEPNETVALEFGTLVDPENRITEGSPAETVVTISDDAPSPAVEVSFGAATYAVAEGSAVDVTVQLDRDGKRDGIVVPIQVVGSGTTADPADYTLSPTSLTFNMGETSKTVTLRAASDSAVESDETVALEFGTLVDPENQIAEGSPAETVVTISDDAPSPAVEVSFGAATYAVAEGGAVDVTVQLDRDGKRDGIVVPIQVVSGSSTTADPADYTLSPTSLTFNMGETSKTVTLRAASDSVTDPDETVTLRLGTPTDPINLATLGSPFETVVTIANAAPPGPRLSPPPPPIGLSLSGTELDLFETGDPGTFTVALDRIPRADVTVDVVSADSARVTADPAQLVFTQDDWDVPQTVTLTALADMDDVDSETVTVTLTPSGTAGTFVAAAVTVTHREVPPVEVLLGAAVSRVLEGLKLAVTVSLSADPLREVTVPLVATPGTAGPDDYALSATSVTFASGETEKTVIVEARADDLEEPDETVGLAVGADLPAKVTAGARSATEVTIENRQRLAAVVQAWTARFGRTAATHVTDAVGERLRGAPGQDSHLTIGGYRLPLERQPGAGDLGTDSGAGSKARQPGAEASSTTAVLAEVVRVLGVSPGGAAAGPGAGHETPWRAEPGPDPRLGRSLTPALNMDLRQVLLGSAFRLNLNATDAGAGPPRLTAWGRFAGTTFDGQDGALAVDGDVFTGTVGVDSEWDRLLAGVAVAHSRGDGSFMTPTMEAHGQGGVEQTLTSLHPYLRYAVTERLDVWGLVGYGWGELDMEMDTGVTVETDTNLVMGAFGGRGIVLAPEDTGGVQVATRTDAMLTRTSTDAAAPVAATDADAHRVRVILEGSRAVAWADGRRLTPTLELGLRHDWGDAETGFGLEVGSRVHYADPRVGLTVEGAVRGLLAHEDAGYEEWGASGTVRLAPGVGGQGLSLTLAPTWGAAASGVESLWSRQTTAGLASPGMRPPPAGRLQAEVGYGFAAFARGLLTPYAGTVLTEGAARTYRVGARWADATGLSLNLEGTRQEAVGPQPVQQGVQVRATWGF